MQKTIEKSFNSTPPKTGMPYYWKVILVFMLGWVFMYADRTILNPVMPILAREFGINNAQLGLINSVFFLAYAILQKGKVIQFDWRPVAGGNKKLADILSKLK